MNHEVRRRWTAAILVGLVIIAAGPATAHQPGDGGVGWGAYSWTCSGGGHPNLYDKGNCYQHHTNADARIHYESSVAANGFVLALNNGYGAWDQTDGHQFNFIRETSDTSTNANVSVVSNTITICGSPTKIACTSMGASGGHTVEGSATIKFHDDIASSLIDDVGAHEFGHYVSLGHSNNSSATMYHTVASGQVSLNYVDEVGRCMIYGHSHAYWGGCTHA